MNKSNCKKFILKNFDKFEYDNINNCFSMKIEKSYYTDITLQLSNINDKFYTVCYWGNRKSWLWFFKKDFYFCANVVIKRKDNYIDETIINKLKTFANENNSKQD